MTDKQNYDIRVATYERIRKFLKESAQQVRENMELDKESTELIAQTLEEIECFITAFSPSTRIEEQEEEFIFKTVEPSQPFEFWENVGKEHESKLGIAANLASGKYNKDENNKS